MMSPCGLDAANLLLVNPLLDRGKADPQLQSRVTELQQLLILLSGFAVPRHRSEIVQSMQSRVNRIARRSVYPTRTPNNIELYRNGRANHLSYTLLFFLRNIHWRRNA